MKKRKTIYKLRPNFLTRIKNGFLNAISSKPKSTNVPNIQKKIFDEDKKQTPTTSYKNRKKSLIPKNLISSSEESSSETRMKFPLQEKLLASEIFSNTTNLEQEIDIQKISNNVEQMNLSSKTECLVYLADLFVNNV